MNNDIVPGATVTLDDASFRQRLRIGPGKQQRGFRIRQSRIQASTYRVTISADGFASWTSPTVIVNPGQFVLVTNTGSSSSEEWPR